MNQVEKPFRYSLSGSTRRIFARLFDFILVGIIMVFISIGFFSETIFSTKYVFDSSISNFYTSNLIVEDVAIESWKVIVFSLIAFIIYFIYFIIIPFIWKGQTLFKKAYKIRTVELKDKKLFFLHLLLKELFIWIYPLLLIFIFVLIKQPASSKQIYDSFILFKSNSSDGVIIAFKVFSIVGAIISLVLFVATIAKTKKRNLHDVFSNTAVILTNPIVEKVESEASPKINLPGLSAEDIKDI